MKYVVEHKNEAGEVIYRINRRTRKGKYFILVSDRQTQLVNSPIALEGFTQMPSGFYTREGYGLTTAGNFMMQEIHDRYGKKINLTVTTASNGRLDARGKTVTVSLPHSGWLNLGSKPATSSVSETRRCA